MGYLEASFVFLAIFALVRCDMEMQCQCNVRNINDRDLKNPNATQGKFITGAILEIINDCKPNTLQKCFKKCQKSVHGLDFDIRIGEQTEGQIFCHSLVKNNNKYVGVFANLMGCKDISSKYGMLHSPQKLCCLNGVYKPGC